MKYIKIREVEDMNEDQFEDMMRVLENISSAMTLIVCHLEEVDRNIDVIARKIDPPDQYSHTR